MPWRGFFDGDAVAAFLRLPPAAREGALAAAGCAELAEGGGAVASERIEALLRLR